MKHFLLFVSALTLCGQAPQFTADNRLQLPKDYREWVYLSSGLGMTYGTPEAARQQNFDNVFVTPAAYREFLKTGTWPDKTMFILEVRRSESNGSINKGGHFQQGVVAIEAEVKDRARFPDGGWGFFDLSRSESAAVLPKTQACYSCHGQNGAVDNTFVQFYPTLLEIARAKGTLKPGKQ